MKKNITNLFKKARTQLMYTATAASVAMMGMPVVHADEATTLMETVIDIIAKLVFIPAGICAITGIIQWASAHSDGDGPATKKAINMISAGIMLAALGIILEATKSTFSSVISTS